MQRESDRENERAREVPQMLEQTHCRERGGREGAREGGGRREMLLTEPANASTDVAAAMGGGMVDDAASLSMKTEGARDGGFCYLGNSDDVMWRVELSLDWLEGCGAPLPGGGRMREMTEQRPGCEEQMKPPAPSLVESRCAEKRKQQL